MYQPNEKWRRENVLTSVALHFASDLFDAAKYFRFSNVLFFFSVRRYLSIDRVCFLLQTCQNRLNAK